MTRERLWMRSLRPSLQTSERTSARITRHFWFLVLLICGLFLEAYMHNFNIVYITLFFLVGLGVAAEFMGRMNLSRLSGRVLSSGRIFAHRPSSYSVQLKNSSDAPCYAITVSNAASAQRVNRIAAHGTAIVTLQASFGARGRGELEATQLQSYYPLPHMRFGKGLEHHHSVIVYPEPKGEPLSALLARNRSLAGEREDFDGVRRFENGDTAALIYWPSVAKGDTVMSKQFIFEEPSRKLHFDFERCGRDDEERLSQLTLWVLECEKAALAFTVTLRDKQLDSQERGIDAILETLALY